MEIVLRLLESKQSAELNPAKMDSLDDACNNAEFLLQVVSYYLTPKMSYFGVCKRKLLVGAGSSNFEHFYITGRLSKTSSVHLRLFAKSCRGQMAGRTTRPDSGSIWLCFSTVFHMSLS